MHLSHTASGQCLVMKAFIICAMITASSIFAVSIYLCAKGSKPDRRFACALNPTSDTQNHKFS